MQSVTAVGPMFNGQKNAAVSDTDPVPESQSAGEKAPAGRNSGPASDLFSKILALGKKAGDAGTPDKTAAGDQKEQTESAENDLAVLLGSVIAQLVPMVPAAQANEASGTQSTDTTDTAAASGIVGGIMPGTAGTLADAAAQAAQAGISAGSAAQTVMAEASEGALPQTVQDGTQPPQNGKNEQNPGPDGNNAANAALFRSNLTEKLRESFASAQGDASPDGFSGGTALQEAPAADSADTKKTEALPFGLSFTGQEPGAVRLFGPGEKLAAVEKAINQIVNDFDSVKAGGSEIQIVLEPKELGVMTITVLRTESGISAKIRSDDKEICALITGHIQNLVQAIENKGIKVDNVDVAFKQTGQDMSFTQNSSGGGGQEKPPAYYAAQEKKTESSDLFTLLSLLQGNFAGDEEAGASIEYRV